MKNLSIVFLALLIVVVSCRKKGDEPIAVESVSLLPAKASVVLNGTHELKATVSPPDAADQSLTWDSDNKEVVTVDQNGVVTGKAPGTAVITATSKSNPEKSAKCEVEVVKETVTSITITPEKPVVAKGATQKLKATVLPAEAAQSVTWSSGDNTKATVDDAGVVTGVEAGETTIIATATDGSAVKGEVKITITVQSELPAAAATITGITLGAEEMVVSVPEPGASSTLSNAPHTIAANLTGEGVQVNITATEGAVIKIGDAPFTSGQKVPFNPSVTFSVTEEGKTGSKEYTLTITPYNKESNPYGIYSPAHLQDMRNVLNGGFKLMDDLTLPAASAGLAGISDYGTAGWMPIGDDSNPFKGSLDGAGHKIDNLYVNRKETQYTGLFGKVEPEGSIKNLEVNTTSEGVTGENATGLQYSGILAGKSKATIENCHTTGVVFSSAGNNDEGYAHAGGLVGANDYAGKIRRCYSTATIRAKTAKGGVHAFAGGLVGYNAEEITDCYAAAEGIDADGAEGVYAEGATSAYAGGLVGNCTAGKVERCYATGVATALTTTTREDRGAFSGGLTGYINIQINNCYAFGRAEAKSAMKDVMVVVGGFAGITSKGASVKNSYATGDAKAFVYGKDTHVGTFLGYNNGTVTNCYRNSDASAVRANSIIDPSDKDISGITAKSRTEMETDAFKDNLNQGQTAVWGWAGGKNNNRPYLIGVGEGK